MNHQAIIDQLTTLAPQLKEASAPEDVLIKYAEERNWSPAQLERVGQFYNIAKTLNFMDKSAARGDSFKVLDNEGMLAKFTKHKSKSKNTGDNKEASDWDSWFESPTKSASEDSEKSAIIKEENGQYTVYSEDGSKRLSKPGTKAEAVKRLRQVEYFKKHKKANSVPNILAMAKEEDYSPYVDVESEPAFKSAMSKVKEELASDSALKFEMESTDRVIFESQLELNKIASELLEMHRLSPIPFAVMEKEAFFCSGSNPSVRKAANAIASYFTNKGWDLTRHDYSTSAPRLVRDSHNSLPLFKSAAEHLDLYSAAVNYKVDLEKAATTKERTEKAEDIPGGSKTPSSNKERSEKKEDESIPGGSRTPEGQGERKERQAAPPEYLGSTLTDKETLLHQLFFPAEKQDKKEDAAPVNAETATKAIKSVIDMYKPTTYMSQTQQQFVNDLLKAPTFNNKNTKQKEVDTAAKDVGRVSTLQRLMLSDPIIGEADPDTVISLYNTLAKANPEIVSDANLLRFALREAIQYEAVPLHTYKDLISMGKDRAETESKQMDIERNRYTIGGSKKD